MNKVILHCDLNNFYASVECLYRPEIRDKPVAVCGSQSTRHGIVLAKNLLAKERGVKTAEAIWEARRKCPDLVVMPPSYALYLRFSAMARDIYKRYTDRVEAFGIDESWLDVTESTRLFGDGPSIANEIRERIRNELGITASVGVSFNKIFAKLGSDMKKPDAVTVINEDDIKTKVWVLPIEELLYVGKSTAVKLRRIGICTIGDLAAVQPSLVEKLLGKWGHSLWMFANGYDDTPVTTFSYDPVIKGIGNSLTTPRDLACDDDVKILLYVLAESVGERLRKHGLKGRTVQVWMRDGHMVSIQRQAGFGGHTNITAEIADRAYEVFSGAWDWHSGIRAIGIRVTDLVTADAYTQLSLFADEDRRLKRELLDMSVDRIRERFGHYSVQRGILLQDRMLNANPAEENVIYPVSYFQ